MSTTSAKPAPSLKEIMDEMAILYEHGTTVYKEAFKRWIEGLAKVSSPPAAERTAIAEIRKRIERESYWCEDCQHEIIKRTAEGADYMDDFHPDHEVVRITVIEGWLATEIDAQELAQPKPTASKAASEQEGAK